MDAVREDFRQYIKALLLRLGRVAKQTNVSGRRERFFRKRSVRVELTPNVRWPGMLAMGKHGPAEEIIVGSKRPKDKRHRARTYRLLNVGDRDLAATMVAMDCKEAEARVMVTRQLLAIIEWVELHDTPDDVKPRLEHRLVAAKDRPIDRADPDEEWRAEWALLGLGG